MTFVGEEASLLASGGGEGDISLWPTNPPPLWENSELGVATAAAAAAEEKGAEEEEDEDEDGDDIFSVRGGNGGGGGGEAEARERQQRRQRQRRRQRRRGIDENDDPGVEGGGGGRTVSPALTLRIGGGAAGRDKVRVWDVASNREGSLLASASGDGAVRLWSLPTSDQLLSSAGGACIPVFVFVFVWLRAAARRNGRVRRWWGQKSCVAFAESPVSNICATVVPFHTRSGDAVLARRVHHDDVMVLGVTHALHFRLPACLPDGSKTQRHCAQALCKCVLSLVSEETLIVVSREMWNGSKPPLFLPLPERDERAATEPLNWGAALDYSPLPLLLTYRHQQQQQQEEGEKAGNLQRKANRSTSSSSPDWSSGATGMVW